MTKGENEPDTKKPIEVSPQKPPPPFKEDGIVASAVRDLGATTLTDPEITPEELEALTDKKDYTAHLKIVEKPVTAEDSERD